MTVVTESRVPLINETNSLTTLSPLDGRYRPHLAELSQLFSEFSLIKHRVTIEILYLIFLSEQKVIPKISVSEKDNLLKIAENFSEENAQKVKVYELKTKHDVKAVEYFLRDELMKIKSSVAGYVHLALTSEDINSLSYSLMLQKAQTQIIVPQLKKVLQKLSDLSSKYAEVPMLARTHGQVAVPTTVGKEIVNFAMRLLSEIQLLESMPIEGKLNGAVGNFNAHIVALPLQKNDWIQTSFLFITSLGLEPNLFTTQILPVESYTLFFSCLVRINSILLDLNQDIWRYISDGYFIQKLEEGQVGSSTMPHKINPIDFENSEGNVGLANALLTHFITKLPISRLQRDLSDSTVKRSFGTALGYGHLAYTSLLKGLSKISVNEKKLADDLNSHWEVLAEAFQVVLRAHGDNEGYEKLQEISQGKQVTQQDLKHFIESVELPKAIKNILRELRPETYVGVAPQLTQLGIAQINKYLQGES